MQKKGQALVEFIIILPVFILLVLGVIDIGRILMTKTQLESEMSVVVDYYKKGLKEGEISEKVNLDVEIKKEDDYINFAVNKEITLITPGLQLILNDPYEIVVTRSILNE